MARGTCSESLLDCVNGAITVAVVVQVLSFMAEWASVK